MVPCTISRTTINGDIRVIRSDKRRGNGEYTEALLSVPKRQMLKVQNLISWEIQQKHHAVPPPKKGVRQIGNAIFEVDITDAIFGIGKHRSTIVQKKWTDHIAVVCQRWCKGRELQAPQHVIYMLLVIDFGETANGQNWTYISNSLPDQMHYAYPSTNSVSARDQTGILQMTSGHTTNVSNVAGKTCSNRSTAMQRTSVLLIILLDKKQERLTMVRRPIESARYR